MPRSTGITVSAVVTIIGSALTILGGAMIVLLSLFLSKAKPAANIPGGLGFFVVIDVIMFFGFGGWGLASGIGLIHLKQWARISMLVFAAILVLISLPVAVLLAVIQLPNTNDLNLPPNFMAIMHIEMPLFYGAFAVLGGFWLYFFNKQSVKRQFQAQPAVESPAPGLPLRTPIAAPVTSQRARPLSITIIGWSLLISCGLGPLDLLSNRSLFSGVQFPFYFLRFFFFGRSAYLIFIGWMVTQMVAAVGLLKLKNWGLFATIGLQCLAVVDTALLVGIPASRARFQQIMDTMIASMNSRMPYPVPFVFPIWVVFAISLPIVFVILWFLITRRQAFTSAAQEPRQHS